MTPEELAREEIDRQLAACGWVVQDHKSMNIMAGPGVAVREFPLRSGFADYLLYVDARVIGVIEAKPEGHTLKGVEVQSSKYTLGLPDQVPFYRKPLPFAYESTGTVTQFTNSLEPDYRSREVFSFHRPEDLLRLVKLDAQVRANLRALPELNDDRMWAVQTEAVRNLEASLAANRPRALIQMATGSGKTYTACSFCYRLIKFGKAKRILFLVDRNNLGRQTLNEFQQYVSPVNGYQFTDEFNVQHLRKNTIDPAAKVCAPKRLPGCSDGCTIRFAMTFSDERTRLDEPPRRSERQQQGFLTTQTGALSPGASAPPPSSSWIVFPVLLLR